MLFMSLTDRSSRIGIFIVACSIWASGLVWADDPLPDTSLTCPATLEVAETAIPVSGWQVGNATGRRKLERISIYNGTNGSREFELAPDDQKEERNRITQVWHLTGYRSINIFLRCRYRGTQVVLSKDIPGSFKTCTFVFNSDKVGNISGTPSFACR
jgi:hypothetical protein